MKVSVAGEVSLASDVMKRRQHFGNSLEILEALELAFFDVMPFMTHERH